MMVNYMVKVNLLLLPMMTVSAKYICAICKCSQTELDCKGQGLENQISDEDWPSINETTEVWLTRADFGNNSLIHIRAFPSLPLEYLSIRNNRIAKIDPGAFFFLANLTELDLSHNQLTSDVLLPDIFKSSYSPTEYQPLHSMRVLRLSYNAIHTLHPDLFQHITHLEAVFLDSNPIRVIDRGTELALSSLPFLKVLDLAYTQLKDLPETMLHTPGYLSSLNLTGNLFVQVPKALELGHSIEELHIAENPIPQIEKDSGFPLMKSLKTLNMCYMEKLTTIGEGGLSLLVSLKNLQICHCPKLTTIHPNALSRMTVDSRNEEWPPISQLDLGHSNLSYLDSHLLGHWKHLELLNIVGNNWVCDCENQWMVNNLMPAMEEIDVNLAAQVRCSQPTQMAGKLFHDMEVKQYHMRCLDTAGNHPEKDGKILVRLTIGIITAIPLAIVGFWAYHYYRVRAGFFPFRKGSSIYTRAFYSPANSMDTIT